MTQLLFPFALEEEAVCSISRWAAGLAKKLNHRVEYDEVYNEMYQLLMPRTDLSIPSMTALARHTAMQMAFGGCLNRPGSDHYETRLDRRERQEPTDEQPAIDSIIDLLEAIPRASLTDIERVVLCERFVMDRSIRTISDSIGKPMSTVHLAIHSAVAKLREALYDAA
jgi:hypothetical protein